jgi:hypothetical protein
MTKIEDTNILGPSTPGLGATSEPKRVYLKELFEEWLNRPVGNTDPVVLSFETSDTGGNLLNFSKTLYFIKDGTLGGLSDIVKIQYEPGATETPPGALALRTYGIVRDEPGAIDTLTARPLSIFKPIIPQPIFNAPEAPVRAPEAPIVPEQVMAIYPLVVSSITSDKPGSVRWDRGSPSVNMTLVDEIGLYVEGITPNFPRWSLFEWMVTNPIGSPYVGRLEAVVIPDAPGIVKNLAAPVTVDRSGGALSRFKDGRSKLYLAIVGDSFRPVDTPWQTQQFQSDGKWAETKEEAIAKGLPVYFPEGSILSYQGEFDLASTATVTQPPITKPEDSKPSTGPHNLNYRVFADRPGINWFRGNDSGEYNFEVKAFNADIGAVQGEDVSGGPEQSNESVIPNNASADQISPHYNFITKQWYIDTGYNEYGDNFYGTLFKRKSTGYQTIYSTTISGDQKDDGFGSAKDWNQARADGYWATSPSVAHYQNSDSIKYTYSHNNTVGSYSRWAVWAQWKYIGKRNMDDHKLNLVNKDIGSYYKWNAVMKGEHHCWRLDFNYRHSENTTYHLIYDPKEGRYIVLKSIWPSGYREWSDTDPEESIGQWISKHRKQNTHEGALDEFNIFGSYYGGSFGTDHGIHISPNPLNVETERSTYAAHFRYDTPNTAINGYEINGMHPSTTIETY